MLFFLILADVKLYSTSCCLCLQQTVPSFKNLSSSLTTYSRLVSKDLLSRLSCQSSCSLPHWTDFSYNKLSDSSGRALGKLLNNHSKLVTLDLTDNKIGAQGAAAIGHALGKNTTLKTLNLRLNRFVN